MTTVSTTASLGKLLTGNIGYIRSTRVELFEERPNLVESRPSSHRVVAPVELDEALVHQFGEDYVMEFVTESDVLLTIEHLVSPKDRFRLSRRLGQQGP